MKSKFDRLYKTIMEEVSKTSRRKIIKESVSIQEEMDAIRVAADIIKRAMAVNKDEVLEELEDDVNYDSSACAFDDYPKKGITREMWENSIKYGWMAETLPYFIDWHDDLFEGIEITPEESAILEKVNNDAYVFSDEFEKGNLEGLDFCKEICSQFSVDIYPEELGIYFAGEDNDMDYESVKKPVSKRRVIKEHKAHRPLKRRVIKESEEDYDDQEEGWDRDYNDYPTITIGDLRKELQKADPNDTIYFGWNCYSDGGEDCCGFNYDEDSNAFYLNQFTFIPEDDEDQDAENTEAPTAQEVLNAIESLSDDVKVFGYWDENEGARYCINKIIGTYIELDGGTEC